jgi:rare lipoprotein A
VARLAQWVTRENAVFRPCRTRSRKKCAAAREPCRCPVLDGEKEPADSNPAKLKLLLACERSLSRVSIPRLVFSDRKVSALAGAVTFACLIAAGAAWRPLPAGAADLIRHAVRGNASWYGSAHHGRRTASGDVFDSESMTAAHKTLPFGAAVRVTNQRNGRSAVVRINDRGPFVRGRIIDLSSAAARAIGISGVARVSLSPL